MENTKKIGKNLKKLKKYHCGFISSQNMLKKAEKVVKQKLSFRFVPTQRVIENSKKKNSENLKLPLWLHFKP